MKTFKFLFLFIAFVCLHVSAGFAQEPESIYGDAVKADVKMKYVYSYEEALKLAKEQNKLIFFNCFVDWALPCHGMNKYVFNNQEFCDYMNEKFINLFMDMNSKEGKVLADKYEVKTFAQYLILNAEGEIVQRIVGGVELPDFKERVDLALSPKTSLMGTQELYAKGDRSKKLVYNYLKALNTAGEDSLFKAIGREYVQKLKPKELAEKKNWMLLRLAIPDRFCERYNYLIENKELFAKNIGAKPIDIYIESLICPELIRYATGGVVYDANAIEALHKELDRAALPDTCVSYVLYHIGKLRGEKKYQDLLNYMDKNGHYLTLYQVNVEMSFNFPDMTPADRKALIDYLTRAAEREKDSSSGRNLKQFAEQLSDDSGIKFHHGPFAEVLKKAKEDNKLVFMDCYTSWCGPCRMMASTVFTRKDVGDYFNEHFISFKLDMEKGEGIDLAKKYKVTAYPTMLILDSEGHIVLRFTGTRTPKELINLAKESLDPKVGYEVIKAAYEAGDRTPEVVYNYIRVMSASGELKDEDMSALVDNYLGAVSDEDFVKPTYWNVIKGYVKRVSDKSFDRTLRLYDKLVANNGQEEVYRMLEKVVFPYVLSYLHEDINKETVSPMIAKIKALNIPEISTLKLLAELVELRDNKQYDEIMKCYKEKVSTMPVQLDRLNLDVLLPYFIDGVEDTYKEQAIEYVNANKNKADSRAQKSYTQLLTRLNAGQK